MADLSPETESLRQSLLPHADLIQRCFDRGLTVQQCAEYLAFARERSECLTLDRLSSQPGLEAIQEVFWTQQADPPMTLFEKILGRTAGRHATWDRSLKFMARSHPYFLSWVPAAALGQETEP